MKNSGERFWTKIGGKSSVTHSRCSCQNEGCMQSGPLSVSIEYILSELDRKWKSEVIQLWRTTQCGFSRLCCAKARDRQRYKIMKQVSYSGALKKLTKEWIHKKIIENERGAAVKQMKKDNLSSKESKHCNNYAYIGVKEGISLADSYCIYLKSGLYSSSTWRWKGNNWYDCWCSKRL